MATEAIPQSSSGHAQTTADSASNPVAKREFLGILRSRKAFAVLFGLTIVFMVAVLLRWPSAGTVDLSGKQSLQVFRMFGYGLLAGVIFLVPAFPAVSIVNEKNDGTLALLLNSPLTPLKIYLGKLAGILMFAALVLMASLPGAAACYVMGGVDLYSGILRFYLLLVLLIVHYVTLAMLVSSYVHTADAGVRITYTAIFVTALLTLLPAAFFVGDAGILGTVSGYLRSVSPIPVLTELMQQSSPGQRGLIGQSTWPRFVVFASISSLVCAVWTLSRLNYRIFDRSRAQGVITDDRSTGERVLRRLMYIVDPQRRKAGIPWYLNPVMVKEFRCRRFGRSQWLFRLVAISAMLSVALTFAAATSVTAWGTETIGGLMVVLQVILIVVLTPSLASGLISGERDGSGWELLRLTPLSASKIIRGKLLSVLWTLTLVLLATLPGYLVMIYIQPQMIVQVRLVLLCLLLTVIYTLAVSAAVGSFFRTTASATTVTYIIVISIFVAPLLVWLGRDAPFGYDFVNAALSTNPACAALSVINSPGFESYDLLPDAFWFAGILSAIMFCLFGYQVWRLTRPV
ncbi:ABC transporter permease [Roseiconus lacunae]|uniref:ABC transporter permease n=1 Tax=Roseiconus lacunae TaxID=2605694 RepID=UPI0011F1E3CB|nr:ABC transporter permease subunit [Roseiconus lacunae]WRQ50675.1 ABC transporter permease subunit [Stieleria sp. HD01]